MCHPEVPPGTALPEVGVRDVAVDLDDGRLPGILALPARTPAPGVLVVNDVFGRSPFYDHLTRRIAQAGRRARRRVLLPAGTRRRGRPRGRDEAGPAARPDGDARRS